MKLRDRVSGSAPSISRIKSIIDTDLAKRFPPFFGARGPNSHPVLDLKPYKIIHDSVWGTSQYDWRELAIIDSPILQRLRDIHQTGLAYLVYPSARHTRFEHCLGTLTIADRIFRGLLSRQSGDLNDIARVVAPGVPPEQTWDRWRKELRVAALLHDSGHCLHSHTSERVYGSLQLLKQAVREIYDLTGKESHAGEVLSFCFTLSDSLETYLAECAKKVLGTSTGLLTNFDMEEAALMVIGRTKHPFTQFLADIVTSGFDSDKLDYLQRDAKAAGIPVAFDIDRYLFFIRIEKLSIVDAEEHLKNHYESSASQGLARLPNIPPKGRPGYEAYRLRLPRQALTALQQIVVSKLMLFSYIYHHPKIRAAEGMVEKALGQKVSELRQQGANDEQVLSELIRITDSCLLVAGMEVPSKTPYETYANRLYTRTLPREVFRLSASASTYAARPILANYLSDLHNDDLRPQKIREIETAIGEELLGIDPTLGSTPGDAMFRTGSWFDVPKEPAFEDIEELIADLGGRVPPVMIRSVLPIGEWTQAYVAYEYWVRIFAFSEYRRVVERAAQAAMERVIGIKSQDFYDTVRRSR